MSFDEQLERAQADGRMSPGDADEVRHFAGFLTALAKAEVPAGGTNRTDEQQATFLRIYAEHYPEDYAFAVAEARQHRAAVAAALEDHDDQMEYGHPTTSPASPGGPEPEGGPDV